MKTVSTTAALTTTDSLALQVFHAKALLFDIETTGFSPKRHQVYLIGCAFRKGPLVTVCQYFAENPDEEPAVLKAFLKLASSFQTAVSFNGLGFDLPFLTERCRRFQQNASISSLQHVDLLRSVSPFRHIFKLENLKQKTLERFLGIHREDTCSGGELIPVYDGYCSAPDEESLSMLLLHNYEDVLGMIDLLPLLSYEALFRGNFSLQGWSENSYRDYEASSSQELIFSLIPKFPLPCRISYGRDDIYLSGCGTEVGLRIKLYEGQLKYFYPNYRDYYYLPQEDVAIHKSVASYVDKKFRTQAKASTCYSKKSGRFLPQYSDRFSPCFKFDYQDKVSYIELNEDFTHSPKLQKDYVLHLLERLEKRA